MLYFLINLCLSVCDHCVWNAFPESAPRIPTYSFNFMSNAAGEAFSHLLLADLHVPSALLEYTVYFCTESVVYYTNLHTSYLMDCKLFEGRD